MAGKTKRITIRIDFDLYSFITRMADLQYMTYSDVVRNALRLMMEQQNQMKDE